MAWCIPCPLLPFSSYMDVYHNYTKSSKIFTPSPLKNTTYFYMGEYFTYRYGMPSCTSLCSRLGCRCWQVPRSPMLVQRLSSCSCFSLCVVSPFCLVPFLATCKEKRHWLLTTTNKPTRTLAISSTAISLSPSTTYFIHSHEYRCRNTSWISTSWALLRTTATSLRSQESFWPLSSNTTDLSLKYFLSLSNPSVELYRFLWAVWLCLYYALSPLVHWYGYFSPLLGHSP